MSQRLSVPVLLAVCLTLSQGAGLAEELYGKIKHVRVARPVGQLNGDASQTSGKAQISVSDFHVGTGSENAEQLPLSGQVTSSASMAPHSLSGATRAEPRAAVVKTDAKVDSEVVDGDNGADVSPDVTDLDQLRKQNSGKHIVIRMTGFNESLELTPVINYDAIRMAQAMRKIGFKVTIFLDRSAVNLVTNGYADFNVNHKDISFQNMLDGFVAQGGNIMVSKYWADQFGISGHSVARKSQIANDEQIAMVLGNSTKVLEYAGPVFPWLYQGKVDRRQLWPPDDSSASSSASASKAEKLAP